MSGYSIHWTASPFVSLSAYGRTPREAIRQARRIRRARFLAESDPGWMTLREQFRWTRIARRYFPSGSPLT